MPRKSKKTQKKMQKGGVKFSKILTVDKFMQLYLNYRRIRRNHQYDDDFSVNVKLIILSSAPRDIGDNMDEVLIDNGGTQIYQKGTINITDPMNIILNNNEDTLPGQNHQYPYISVDFEEIHDSDLGLIPDISDTLYFKIPNNTNEVRDALHTDGVHDINYLLEIIDDPMLKDTTKMVSTVAHGVPVRQRTRRDAMTIGTAWGPDSIFLPDFARHTIRTHI